MRILYQNKFLCILFMVRLNVRPNALSFKWVEPFAKGHGGEQGVRGYENFPFLNLRYLEPPILTRCLERRRKMGKENSLAQERASIFVFFFRGHVPYQWWGGGLSPFS